MALCVSCSWCHQLNEIKLGEVTYCPACHHRADRVRTECDCERCRNPNKVNKTDAENRAAAFTRVAGRGVKSPVLSWVCYKDRAELRVDDELNPELWLEISLSFDALMDLVGGVMSAEKSAHQNAPTVTEVKPTN